MRQGLSPTKAVDGQFLPEKERGGGRNFQLVDRDSKGPAR